jgi:hypothetical protein
MKRTYCFFLLLLFVSFAAVAAPDTIRVLFVGNSYVQVNNLPDIIEQLAANRGDVLLKTDVSIGGYTFQNHFANMNTRNQIAQKGWDFVVLQEQSQTPAFPDAQVASACYPYARALDSLVHLANPCAKTLFYMTWGRKNGDAGNCPSFPLICTYNGMDSLLRTRYTIMAQNNKSVLSPVGVAWHKMRDLFPATELYQADESHPSEAGSYLAACTFYSILFKKSPAGITYDYNLSASDAGNIRQVVKGQVWDSLSKWYQHRTTPAKPVAGFTQSVSGLSVQFNNSSQSGIRYQWIFGDGKGDTSTSPKHIYAANGSYSVRLIAINCDGVRDTLTRQVTIGTTGAGGDMSPSGLSIFPNPAKGMLHLECTTQPVSITLYNIAGRACRSMAHPQSKVQSLDLNGLPAGAYLLRVLYQDGAEVARMVSVVN